MLSSLIVLTAPLLLAQQSSPTQANPQAPVSVPYKIGDDVLPPKLTHSVEPKYPHPFFHRPKSSNVLVGMTVTIEGTPTDIHIVRSGGASFDKSALEATRQYRFDPATRNGQPVAVQLNVDVNFQIF
jgi:TonB family protein